MRNETEKDIQRAIIDYLRLKRFIVFKHNSTQFGVRNGEAFALKSGDRGISDIICCSLEGRFVAIECKTKKGVPTEEQLAFLKAVILNKGIAFIARSLDDVVDALKKLS